MGLDQNLMRRRKDGEIVDEIYWRKANCVHLFFTEDWEEKGYESDNCTEFPVSVTDLLILALKCEKVLEDESMAQWELPTTSGFFFGSTEYDFGYFQDIEYTKDEVTKLLTERPLEEGEEFFYHAWY